MLSDLLKGNTAWSAKRQADDPECFARQAVHQAPTYFWIGCCDSRVPANVVTGLDPGEVFVHCNVANIVHSTDMNLLAALEYAVEVLKVHEIVICGHYGCGGVQAATESLPRGISDLWLEPIRQIARANAVALAVAPGPAARLDRLAELNVIEGVRRVAETPILQRAWAAGADVRVHGLIYGLKDGLLRDLGCSVGGR